MVNPIFLARFFLLGLGVIAIYMAVSGKSPEEISLVPCPFHSITDVPCPGCGMTRACIALTHVNFADAWHYHPFAFLVVGLAIGITFFPLQLRAAWNRSAPLSRNVVIIIGIFLCLSLWVYKLCT